MKKKKTMHKKSVLQSPTTNRESSTKRDPWGCVAGTITFQPNVDLTEPSGEIWNAEADKATKQS
jgi:hypothetical protein